VYRTAVKSGVYRTALQTGVYRTAVQTGVYRTAVQTCVYRTDVQTCVYRTAHCVQQHATVCTVRGTNRCGARFSSPIQKGPGGHPNSHTSTEVFNGAKWPRASLDQPPTFGANFILRCFNSVFSFTVLSFPLNRCACLTISFYAL